MLREFVNALSRLYTFVVSLVIALVLGVATWAMWQYYGEVKLQDTFLREGTSVTVPIREAHQEQRSWHDILSNTTYLTVEYKGNNYTCRYVMDSGYVGAGDRVKLLYHPGHDAFRQHRAGITLSADPNRKSRLIQWSTIQDFTPTNRLLFFCLIMSTASFFFISGLIVSVIPIPFLQTIARLVLVLALACAAVFFTYDTVAYFRYYQHLKTNGQRVTVSVSSTHKTAHGRKYSWYDYKATVRFRNHERVIPISGDDFDRLTPAQSMIALYDPAVDDLMSADFPPEYGLMVMPLFFGLLVFLFFRPVSTTRKTPRPTAQYESAGGKT